MPAYRVWICPVKNYYKIKYTPEKNAKNNLCTNTNEGIHLNKKCFLLNFAFGQDVGEKNEGKDCNAYDMNCIEVHER
jgi:hypothetical protein